MVWMWEIAEREFLRNVGNSSLSIWGWRCGKLNDGEDWWVETPLANRQGWALVMPLTVERLD